MDGAGARDGGARGWSGLRSGAQARGLDTRRGAAGCAFGNRGSWGPRGPSGRGSCIGFPRGARSREWGARPAARPQRQRPALGKTRAPSRGGGLSPSPGAALASLGRESSRDLPRTGNTVRAPSAARAPSGRMEGTRCPAAGSPYWSLDVRTMPGAFGPGGSSPALRPDRGPLATQPILLGRRWIRPQTQQRIQVTKAGVARGPRSSV